MLHRAYQNVVAFPSPKDAAAFYAASISSWSSCSNRQLTDTNGSGSWAWSVGAMSTQGLLTISATSVNNPTWTLQRALTVKTNVVIDISAASYSPSTQLAVDIANQIAAKVPE